MSTSSYSLARDRIPVVLLEGIHDRAEEVFRSAGYTNVRTLPGALSGDALREELADARIVGIRSRSKLTDEVLDAAPRLIAIGCFCIGTDQVALQHAARAGVPVFHAPHSNTRSVAELVVGEAVMLLRGVFAKSVAAHAGEWQKSAAGAHEVRGRVIGIVGYGHIGSQVSALAEAFGMRVLYHDIVPKLTLGNAHAAGSLGDLLEQSDVVTLHVPDTSLTRGMIGAAEIARMRPGSFLVNASRGSVVDVDALAASLRAGHLAGAAVDVFPREPSEAGEALETPLRGLSNVILTPHVGGSTVEAQRNIAGDVAAQLIAYSDRGDTTSAVNFPRLSLAPHAEGHRVLHVHENRPGVLMHVNQVMADMGVNILGQHLQTRGDVGYVVLDVDSAPRDTVLPPLRAVAGTIRARILY